MCAEFRLDPIIQIGATQLFKVELAEASGDAWTLHWFLPREDIQLKWTERKTQLDLGATSSARTLLTHCVLLSHKFCGGFFSHCWTEELY